VQKQKQKLRLNQTQAAGSRPYSPTTTKKPQKGKKDEGGK